MKSAVGILALVASVSFILAAPAAVARPGGFVGHAGGFSHGGGGAHFSPHGAYAGGYRGGWGGRGWYGHGWGGGVYIDPWWGVAAYPYAYPYYGYPGVAEYDAPAYAAPAAPPVYVQQGEANAPAAAQGDWFYCQNPAGYYPYVKNCAQGWQRVPARPAGAQ